MPICPSCHEAPIHKSYKVCRVCRIAAWNDLLSRNLICTKCKLKPHAKSSQWCSDCKNASTRARRLMQRGAWYRTLTPEQKMKRNRRNIIWSLVARGKMLRKPCEVCGDPKSEAHHHRGYSWKFRHDVMWLCKTHHQEAENKLTSLIVSVSVGPMTLSCPGFQPVIIGAAKSQQRQEAT